jgi:hypothetical protein
MFHNKYFWGVDMQQIHVLPIRDHGEVTGYKAAFILENTGNLDDLVRSCLGIEMDVCPTPLNKALYGPVVDTIPYILFDNNLIQYSNPTYAPSTRVVVRVPSNGCVSVMIFYEGGDSHIPLYWAVSRLIEKMVPIPSEITQLPYVFHRIVQQNPPDPWAPRKYQHGEVSK